MVSGGVGVLRRRLAEALIGAYLRACGVPKGRLNFRAVQIRGLVNDEELTLLDKPLLQPELGNQVGSHVILCRPFRDSILFR